MSQDLKILRTEIKNFKGLLPMEVDFGGKSVMVIGANDSNKSSFIQAVMCSMNSSYKPLEPINDESERASVIIELGNEERKEYTVEMYFSQDNKKGRLILKDHEDAVITSPTKSLDQIIGNISFNIAEFVNLAKTDAGNRSKDGVRKQIEILRGLLPDDIKLKLSECDAGKKKLISKRSDMNAEIKVLEAQNKHEFTDDELEKYGEEMSTEQIEKGLKDIGKSIEDWTKAAELLATKEQELEKGLRYKDAKTDDYDHNLKALVLCDDSLKNPVNQEVITIKMHIRTYADSLNEIIEGIKGYPDLEKRVAAGKKWLEANDKPSTEKLLVDQKAAAEHNKKYAEIAKMKTNFQTIQDKKKEVAKIAENIEGWDQKKKEIFSTNPLPVKKLEFDDENVLYRGLPFNEEQFPSSTLIGVGVKIAMAMNPNLKVIVIKDGSLLDKKMANGLLKMVEKKGYQLFIEMVDWEGGDMEIKFMEKEI